MKTPNTRCTGVDNSDVNKQAVLDNQAGHATVFLAASTTISYIVTRQLLVVFVGIDRVATRSRNTGEYTMHSLLTIHCNQYLIIYDCRLYGHLPFFYSLLLWEL